MRDLRLSVADRKLHESLEADTLGVPKEKREGHGAKAVSEGRESTV